MSKIHKIVLCGGPAGGKTSALIRISERLESLGFRVYCVPEAATMTFNGGVKRADLAENYYNFGFQEQLMKLQIALEQTFVSLAKDIAKPSVIICDRGLMDAKGFINPAVWRAILDHNDWSEVGLRDKHYDAVIHIVTAAIGAEKFYNCDTNRARTETAEQAAEIDNKIKEAWMGHPHFRVIDNSTGFEEKMNRVLAAVCRVVGVPEPLEIEKKYLVSKVEPIPTPHSKFDIEQIYIKSKNGEEFRIRRRGDAFSNVYTKTIKKDIRPGVRTEIETKINSRDYLKAMESADIQEIYKLSKTRTCFLWENRYFELDEFQNGMKLLEIELDNEYESINLPPFIKIEKEVTEDKSFSNLAIAKRNSYENF